MIFLGIKLRIIGLSGRMSCVSARASDITKMFSFSRTVRAGKSEGILIGIKVYSSMG